MNAFLLLKPDCLRRGLTRDVERTVSRAGLRITCRHRLDLTPDDTRFLWSEYTDSGHVLARAFLDRYLCGGPSEVLLLSGPDAFEKARQVKRSVRSRHAMGLFANVVHAAERPGELARQGNRLAGHCAACSSPFPVSSSELNPVRPAGVDFREHADIARLVDELWPRLQVDLTPPAPFRLAGEPVAAVYLGGDRDHSLDSAVTAVWRALPGVPVGDALMLNLYAGRVGGYPIAVGGHAAVEQAYRVLRDHGIRECGTGPYRQPA
ncbi:nucleoside-diphosphate kinase [Actinoplanes sp. NBC_00393]|uniref:nucleoside-diphosphate kinase n=1 Tax=Actinoplanes sp. NBC_00393 TaxID=2975953 RepID=UPI002E1EF7AF